MSWFRRWREREPSREEAGKLLDSYHPRASMTDGEKLLVNLGKVFDNIRLVMERLDLDINTAISIDEDFVGIQELLAIIESMRMGPMLQVHVANTAMAIMSRRYPAELVTRPLPPEFDLRVMTPIMISDELHETAKTIFNLRTLSPEDLDESDISGLLDGMDGPDQATIFTALIYMYGTKISAMKNRTGID